MAGQTIRIVSFAGNVIRDLPSVILSDTTGWDLKRVVAETLGFPSASMRLIGPAGSEIGSKMVLAEALGVAQADECIVVTCALGALDPIGPKKNQDFDDRNFPRKGGLLLHRRIWKAESGKHGKMSIANQRTPSTAMRDPVRTLIVNSFADGLEGLIDVALDAAFGITDDEAASPFVFEDPDRGTCTDLSTCRLWVRVLTDDTNAVLWRASAGDFGIITNAVLWRLLDGWAGSTPGCPGGQVRGGPVLEVLFLATRPDLREEGQACKLVQELEEAASTLGCAAVAVAAVPVQGRSFWSKCGYEVVVPLAAEQDERLGHDAPGPGDPSTALGGFLRQNMVLFSDTPLVAKVLPA